MDDHELLPGLRQPAAARRPCRGPARAPPHVPQRAWASSRRLAGVGARRQRGAAVRRARRPGTRRGDALAGRAVDHHDHLHQGRQRAHALGAWGAVGGAGAAIGVLLGGALTELVGWRAIFLINVPIGIAVAVAAMQARPARRRAAADGAASTSAARCSRRPASAALVFAALAGRRRRLDVDCRRSASAFADWPAWPPSPRSSAARAAAAAHPAARRPRRRRRVRHDARRVGRAVRARSCSSRSTCRTCSGPAPLETGLAFLPLAVATGAGRPCRQPSRRHAGVRGPDGRGVRDRRGRHAAALGRRRRGSYVGDVLPGMLVAGLGLGIALVSVAVSVLTGAADEETGMLSGLNTTGHEIGGSHRHRRRSSRSPPAALGARPRAAAARGRPRRRLPRRAAASPVAARCRRAGRAALGGELPSQAARSRRASPSTAARCPPPNDLVQPTAPARGCRAQHRQHPRRRRRRAGADPDASMAQIARRAGVVRATIYVHFPTREALLDAVTDRASPKSTPPSTPRNPTAAHPPRRSARVVAASLADLGRYQGLVAINTQQHAHDELLRARHASVAREAQPLIERGQADGSFRARSPASPGTCRCSWRSSTPPAASCGPGGWARPTRGRRWSPRSSAP